ncbi:TPA: AbrB/MazE/SpoVT family DNA-binding domain-containing protein [Candidatus Woesearchaeota archaeon]|nr:AbrB/MazE/SpoVT family DNA-binding domain-containing protein [Candidatus Woesearchaeota archaeon]
MSVVKRWGSSMAVILPQELIRSQSIREGDDVVINIFKKGDLTDVFGTLKTKFTGQQLKDLAREGWESSADRKFRKSTQK